LRGLVDEPVGVVGVRGVQDVCTCGADSLGLSIVDVDYDEGGQLMDVMT
jgi:hypothetical protein